MLQHEPHALHTVPAFPQVAGPEGRGPQTPIDLPAAMVHAPEQHSSSLAQTSPGCVQNDDSWHVPFAHRAEQHCQSPPHGLPSVRQVVLRGAHFPDVHFPPQQLASVVQVLASPMHAVAFAHLPAVH
jgi:hypothetical protein